MDEDLTKHIRTILDDEGKVAIWPAKKARRLNVLEFMASCFQFGKKYTEPEVNNIIRENHSFGDHVLLRRELFESGFMNRTLDGRAYWLTERTNEDK